MQPELPPLAHLMRDYAKSLKMHSNDDEIAVRAFEDFQQADDLDFACDFTEIHAYCDIFSVRNIGYTDITNFEKQVALNEALLNILFFSRRPVYLLPSYKIELSNFERNIGNDALSEISSGIAELKRQQNNPKAIKKTTQQVLENLSGMSSVEPFGILRKIYETAPTLMLLLKSDLRSRQRLEMLKLRGNFRSVYDGANLKSIPDYSNTSTLDWWQSELQLKRPDTPHSSNIIDAVALARLQAINSTRIDRQPIVLITRSNAMRKILSDNLNKRECRHIYMFHPRVLGLYRLANKSSKSFRTMVVDRYWLLRDTLDRIERIGPSYEYGRHPELAQMIRRVQNLWAESEDLTIASSVWNLEIDSKPIGKIASESVENIRSYLASHKSVREMLLERATEIASDLTVSNAEIGVMGVIDQVDRGRIISFGEKDRQKPSAAIYNIKLASSEIPYSLQLYSIKFIETGAKVSDAVSMLNHFIQTKNVGYEYEQRVATSYLLASMGAWELAFSFANSALEVQTDDVPKHEGFYYRALARRHSLKDARSDDIVKSIDDISQANKIKQSTRGSNYWDPRYLNEYGVLLASSAVDMKNEHPLVKELGGNPIPIWREALARVKDDFELSVMLRNNMLYYSIIHNDQVNIGYYFDQLEGVISAKTSQNIPLAARHTIEVARFRLYKIRNFDLFSIIENLEVLADKDDLPEHFRDIVNRDIELVTAEIAGRQNL